MEGIPITESAAPSFPLIQNSTLNVAITLQIWTPDNLLPFFDELIKKGFQVSQPNPMQQMQGLNSPLGRKETTTLLFVDNQNRRIVLTITNQLTDPSRNINDALDALRKVGFPEESIERVDIGGDITIAVEANTAFSYFENVASGQKVKKTGEIFEREGLKFMGVAFVTAEPLSRAPAGSPFFLRLEPLLTDSHNTRILVNAAYSSDVAQSAVAFAKSLYDRLKITLQTLREAS